MDRIHALPRIWSNAELRRFAHLFRGDIVNVSAWRDEDKEGGTYARYFRNAASYRKTNYLPEQRGHQGTADEIFLDLAAALPPDLDRGFDVVFNHTTLEHVFDFRKAFANLCRMSRDAVILVVPWMQQMHSQYGDYWRFSPLAIDRLFTEEGFRTAYLSFNRQPRTSVYVFAIATLHPDRWRDDFDFKVEFADPDAAYVTKEPFAGCNVIMPPVLRRLKRRVKAILH